jgi:hypothetical protein
MLPDAWRIPDRAERERDRRYLEQFLTPTVAAAIASMPVAIIESAPLSLRVDAWCWRASRLLAVDINVERPVVTAMADRWAP